MFPGCLISIIKLSQILNEEADIIFDFGFQVFASGRFVDNRAFIIQLTDLYVKRKAAVV